MKKELCYSSHFNEIKLVRNNELTRIVMGDKVHTYSDRQLQDISDTIQAYLKDKELEKNENI